jgi:hypothetical protein
MLFQLPQDGFELLSGHARAGPNFPMRAAKSFRQGFGSRDGNYLEAFGLKVRDQSPNRLATQSKTTQDFLLAQSLFAK